MSSDAGDEIVRSNPVGDFLRARRALVAPAEAGLTATGPRRVPGLRREEVAMLAGISADYYLRLERGRGAHPSPQVLTAIGRVLRLDARLQAHLLGLAAGTDLGRRVPSVLPDHLRNLVAALGVPAFVEDWRYDVLAVNPLGHALIPGLAPGGNRIRSFFLDPSERGIWIDRHAVGDRLVSALRASIGTDPRDLADPAVLALVSEVSAASADFSRAWERHDVGRAEDPRIALDHPDVGRIDLFREKLLTANGLTLATFVAEPGSPSAERLARLADGTR